MPVPQSPETVVRAVMDGVSNLVAGDLSPSEREAQLDDLAGLYAENTDVRHPFSPLGDEPLYTRSDLRRHFADGPGGDSGVAAFDPTDVFVHQTSDPEVVIAEFRYAARIDGNDGNTVVLPCIFVVRVRDGVIVESRDYADHVGFARAFGRLGELAEAMTGR